MSGSVPSSSFEALYRRGPKSQLRGRREIAGWCGLGGLPVSLAISALKRLETMPRYQADISSTPPASPPWQAGWVSAPVSDQGSEALYRRVTQNQLRVRSNNLLFLRISAGQSAYSAVKSAREPSRKRWSCSGRVLGDHSGGFAGCPATSSVHASLRSLG